MTANKNVNENILELKETERDILKISTRNDNINYEYCDVNKYNEFKWIEIENIIDTNDVEYNGLDESNKVLYRLYEYLKHGALIKDKSFHKLFLLHADDVNDWKSIVPIDKFREKLNNDYYLYVAYDSNNLKSIVRYFLIDPKSKLNGIDIIEENSARFYNFYDKLFVFTHEYLKDIDINPSLKEKSKEGSDGDIFTIIYPHLFTEYNFDEKVFYALFLNSSINDLFTTIDSLHWDNWALSETFLNKYNEAQGLIEQIIFKDEFVDYVNEISTKVDNIDYEAFMIYFTVYNDNCSMKFKAKLMVNSEYYLDDVVIEEIY